MSRYLWGKAIDQRVAKLERLAWVKVLTDLLICANLLRLLLK